jgi:hypothetical protein
MQGTINRATLFDELQLNNQSKSHFKKYFDNKSGTLALLLMVARVFYPFLGMISSTTLTLSYFLEAI